MADKEALDAVSDRELALGLHMIAAAVVCAKGSTADELDLARRILLHNPKRPDAPRESESIAAAFNRHMDAAIESCNDSAANPTRFARRARLAADLDRAGLVLLDRAQLAELLIAADLPALTAAIAEDCEIDLEQPDEKYPELAAELLDGSWIAASAVPSSSGGVVCLEANSATSTVTNSPTFDVDAIAATSAYGNPNVND